MIHPDTELKYISKEIGYGVVAKKLIKEGTITWALDKLDREFTPAEIRKMDDVYKDILDTYSYRNNIGNFVLCWDNARFVNHSFNSTCFSTAYDFEIAIRDIQPGEQLTDDYGYLNISTPFKPVSEGTKRKIVYPDDIVRYSEEWDKKLLNSFIKINSVHQPLKNLLKKNTINKIDKIIAGKAKMDSILTCYFEDKKK
jgi:uncharacterized protein